MEGSGGKMKFNLLKNKTDELYSIKTEFSERKKVLLIMSIGFIFLAYILIHGMLISDENLKLNFAQKFLSPGKSHIFGTDSMGRDMYLRTIKGLSISIIIGSVTSFISLCIAVIFTILLSTFENKMDCFINWLIDVFLSIPHMVFLIVISVSLGRGFKGVVVGIALTHWTSITRIIRGEILILKKEKYIAVSKAMGKSKIYIAIHHIMPKVLPQLLVGSIILFPHVILHEAAMTFLGFGFDPSIPAIGIILSESMKYLIYGYWHLAIFPGMALIIVVILINSVGEGLKNLVYPNSYHR